MQPDQNKPFHSDAYLNWFDRHNLQRPDHAEWSMEDLEKNMKKLKPNSWRLEGNKLIGETEFGPLVNYIPTNYILEKVDEDGMPVFKKIEL